jgi:recombination protein RecA
MYGKGISKEGSLLDVGVDIEIIKKSGAWFTYEGEQLGQGKENARQFLAEHQDVATEIDRRVREAVGLTAFGEEGSVPVDVPVEVTVVDEEPPDEDSDSEVKGGKKIRETTGAAAG